MNKALLGLSLLASAASVFVASCVIASSAKGSNKSSANEYTNCINTVLEHHYSSNKDVDYEAVKNFCFFTLKEKA